MAHYNVTVKFSLIFFLFYFALFMYEFVKCYFFFIFLFFSLCVASRSLHKALHEVALLPMDT